MLVCQCIRFVVKLLRCFGFVMPGELCQTTSKKHPTRDFMKLKTRRGPEVFSTLQRPIAEC